MNGQILKSSLLAAALAMILPSASLAQEANPQAVSMYNLGLTAYKQGSPESAIIFFRRATDIDPNLADAQYNLAIIYQTEKRYKDAIPRFLEVLRIKPTDPDAHFQLGVIYQEMGQPYDAKQHLSAIAPNNPHFAEAQSRIVQINSQPASGVGQAVNSAQPQLAGLQPNINSGYLPGVQQPAQTSAYPQTSAQNTQPYQSSPNQYQPTTGDIGQTTGQSPYGLAQSNYTASATESQPVHPTGQITAEQSPAQTPPAAASQPAPAVVSNPVPVLANATLRIIATGFNAPAGLAFDRSGNLYVANFLSNTIDRISTDGSRTQFSSGANLKGPIGLAVDDNSNLYVANYNGGNVARISPAGVAIIVATGFRKPYYLTLDHDGNLYVSQQEDNSIVRITLPRSVGSRP